MLFYVLHNSKAALGMIENLSKSDLKSSNQSLNIPSLKEHTGKIDLNDQAAIFSKEHAFKVGDFLFSQAKKYLLNPVKNPNNLDITHKIECDLFGVNIDQKDLKDLEHFFKENNEKNIKNYQNRNALNLGQDNYQELIFWVSHFLSLDIDRDTRNDKEYEASAEPRFKKSLARFGNVQERKNGEASLRYQHRLSTLTLLNFTIAKALLADFKVLKENATIWEELIKDKNSEFFDIDDKTSSCALNTLLAYNFLKKRQKNSDFTSLPLGDQFHFFLWQLLYAPTYRDKFNIEIPPYPSSNFKKILNHTENKYKNMDAFKVLHKIKKQYLEILNKENIFKVIKKYFKGDTIYTLEDSQEKVFLSEFICCQKILSHLEEKVFFYVKGMENDEHNKTRTLIHNSIYKLENNNLIDITNVN